MATLFEIGDDLRAMDALLDECEGDVSDPRAEAAVAAWFAELGAAEAQKLDGYVNLIKLLEGEAAVARSEAEEYAARAAARENRAAALKGRLKLHLEMTGRAKVATATGRVLAVQPNGGRPPLVLADAIDPAALPEAYRKVRHDVDRAAVLAALEAGEALAFARLGDRGTHLRIR